jgi:hypothetical protein
MALLSMAGGKQPSKVLWELMCCHISHPIEFRSIPSKGARWYMYFHTNFGLFMQALKWNIWVNLYGHFGIFRPFGVFYRHLVYIFCGHLENVFPFLYAKTRKIRQP